MPENFHTRILQRTACLAAIFFFAAAAICAQQPPANPNTAPAATSREVIDETGRAIRISQPVRRIVSLAPSLTETVYALGLQDLLVGDTDFCDFPPEAKLKTKVGGPINPSLEEIASLHPDLVLVTKSLNRLETVNALSDLGFPSYATDPHTVAEIISSTRRLAGVLGAPDAGSALVTDVQRRLANMQQRLAPFPPRRVLFVVWTEPLISIGKDTFIADALQHAGAVSIVDSSQSWPQLNLEEVVRLQPEFLVFAESHSQSAPHDYDRLPGLPGWRILDAVRNRRFAVVSDAVNRPSPRIVSAIEDLAYQLHPEAFASKPPRDKENDNTDKPNNPPPAAALDFPRAASFAPLGPAVTRECACAR